MFCGLVHSARPLLMGSHRTAFATQDESTAQRVKQRNLDGFL